MLPRLHLFEVNDSPWAPVVLREILIESLSRALEWGHLLEPVAQPFHDFIEQCGVTEVLDLAAGAGAPAAIFARELRRKTGKSPKFLLTDIHPYPAEWKALQQELPEDIDFVPESIDATAIPPELGKGRARIIINALHHFTPEVAGKVVRGACEGAPGIFIVEALSRNPLSFAAMGHYGFGALMSHPLRATNRKLTRAALTWLSPISLAVSIWDGTVSSMRTHSREDLMAMVAPLGDGWRWEYGEFSFNALSKGSWFRGVRV